MMSSIAGRNLNAIFTMSYVEFHRVLTSRGMRRTGSLLVVQALRHAGRAAVVEWMIAKDNFRILRE